MNVRSMVWKGDALLLLDQRQLPHQTSWLTIRTWQGAEEAIRTMAVRGAPAIGICAAYGLALAALTGDSVEAAAEALNASRPTAVNLRLAVERILALPDRSFDSVAAEAQRIEREDADLCEAIAEHGQELVPQGANIMTICNTGAIATGGDGTALAIIRKAHRLGKEIHVWSCETRPRLQGLRLTAWELLQEGIPFHSIADSAAASLMAARKVDLIVAGADRIAANGDTANKIGTLMLAVIAKHFQIPFCVAAPSTSCDPSIASGAQIPIEERSADELTAIEGIAIAPEGTPVFNPAFDVTPAELITAHVMENGVFRPPYRFGEGSR